jgi:ABC-type glycerol-3-phosphate transport system permease component
MNKLTVIADFRFDQAENEFEVLILCRRLFLLVVYVWNDFQIAFISHERIDKSFPPTVVLKLCLSFGRRCIRHVAFLFVVLVIAVEIIIFLRLVRLLYDGFSLVYNNA